jgi:hypothetical protein
MGSTAVRCCRSEKNVNIVAVQTDILGDNNAELLESSWKFRVIDVP